MKFKKSTVFLFASAIVLGTGVFIYEVTIAPQLEETKLQQQKVFDFELDDAKLLTLETPERTLEFSRVESETESAEPQWEMKVLNSSQKLELNDDRSFAANEAYVSFLLSLLINAQSDLQIPLSPEQKTEYGLDKPQATIDFTLNNDERYQLILGGRDFSDNLLYAIASSSAEPNAKPVAILLPTNFENGVNRPLSEWKAEPDTTDKNKAADSESKSTEEQTSTPEPNPDLNSQDKSNETAQPKEENSDPSTPENQPNLDLNSQDKSNETAQPKEENSDLSTPENTQPEKVESETSTPLPEPKKVEPQSDVPPPETEDDTTSSE
ncbi:MAG: DUF4340 domain-containing protein [Geitlerinemataceae cyanobacterium]